MVGPFARSLRTKLVTLAVSLAVLLLGLGGFATHLALQDAAETAQRLASTLASNNQSIASRDALVSATDAALESALVHDFGGQGSLSAYAIVTTGTGGVVARSAPYVQPLPPAQWVETVGRGRTQDVALRSCIAAPLPPIVGFTAGATNAIWNLLEREGACYGPMVRAAEVVSIGRLPKGLSGRTIVPMSSVYTEVGILVGGAVAASLCLLGFLLYVHRRVVRPLRTIRHGAVIMAQGNLNHHIAVKNKDEIGVVANFINEVGRNLQKVRSELIDRQRIASELDAAAKIQQQLLPAEIPQVPGLLIAARTRPSTEVGGDNYDFIQLDEENTLIFIGDVTGHGVPAGLVMIMVDVLIDAFSTSSASPKQILSNVNRILKPNIDSTMYMTMLMLNFNIKTQKLLYAGAGHEHIVHYHARTRKCSATRSGGIALGMIPDIERIVQEQEIPLEVGDAIVLYSDGITEAYGGRENKEMFGLDRLMANVEKSGHRDAAGIFDATTRALADFMGNAAQNDDITLMVLKYVGASQTDIDKAAKRIKLSVVEGDKKISGKRWEWDKKVGKDKLSVTVPT